MVSTKSDAKERSHQPIELDSAAVDELRLACKAKDPKRVRELLDNGSITAEDATACLEETWRDLPLMRLLLEHGADPAACASRYYIRQSFDLIKLLAEFGLDISINGHLVLQYVSQIFLEE